MERTMMMKMKFNEMWTGARFRFPESGTVYTVTGTKTAVAENGVAITVMPMASVLYCQ